MGLKGSKTEQNLKDAFAGESQANRRYLYFANKADIEGQNDVAALFRSTAEGETGHAHGHLEFLEQGVGDPATGLPIGSSRQNLMAAVAGETHEYTDMNAYATSGGVDKKKFEAYALAASIVGKCHFCVSSHYALLKKEGLTTQQLRDIGRIAAVVNAAAQAIAAG